MIAKEIISASREAFGLKVPSVKTKSGSKSGKRAPSSLRSTGGSAFLEG